MPGETILVIDDSPTILKLVQLVLAQAGHRVITAATGESGIHVAKDEKPDLILLDYVLPDMSGWDVWGAMSGDTVLSRIPTVIMSTRADEVAGRFANAGNVFDSITKPFSPDALLAVVAHTLDKAAEQSGNASETKSGPRGGRLFPTPTPPEPGDQSKANPPATPGDAPTLEEGFGLLGDLGAIPLPDVLTLLADQGHTGLLSVWRSPPGAGRIELHLRDGTVDFALAAGVSDEFLLGRFLLENGALTEPRLSDVLTERATMGSAAGLLGADLLRRGLVDEETLRAAMVAQTTALVYEGLRWDAGRFAFRPHAERPAAVDGAALRLAVDTLLLEGLRRVDEWRLIEREVTDFDQVYLRNDEKLATLGRGQLTRDEVSVLELVNGRNSVKDVIYASRMGSFDVSKILYRLLRSKLIRRRVPPLAV